MHLRPTFLITFSLSLVLVSVVVGMLALVLSHDRAVDAEGNFFQTGVDAARIAHITKGDVLTQTVSVHRRHIREIDVLLPERLEGQVTVIQTSTDVVVPFTTSWREEAGRSWMILTFAEEAQYEPGTYKVRVEPISNTAVEVSHPISYRAGEMHINNESGNGNLFFVARYAPPSSVGILLWERVHTSFSFIPMYVLMGCWSVLFFALVLFLNQCIMYFFTHV